MTQAWNVVVQAAETAAMFGTSSENFADLIILARALRAILGAAFPGARYGDFDEALDLQVACLDEMAATATGLPMLRNRAVDFCRNAADRIAGDLLPLQPETLAQLLLAPQPIPAVRQRQQPEAELLGIPELRLPRRATVPALEKLTGWLDDLKGYEIVPEGQDPQNPTGKWTTPLFLVDALSPVVTSIIAWGEELDRSINGEKADGSPTSRPPSEESVEKWESQKEVLESVQEKLLEATLWDDLEEEDIPEHMLDQIEQAMEELGNWE